jgi:CRP-like cAMP-binding protein
LPALRNVSDEALHALAAESRVRESPARGMVLWVDESRHALVVVGKGRCRLLRPNHDGEVALVRCLEAGELLASMPETCYLEADVHGTVIYIVPYAAYAGLASGYPALALAMDVALRQELDLEREAHADLAACDSWTSLAHLLARLARTRDEPVIALTTEELAQMVGSAPESVRAWLAGFEQAGWIKREDSLAGTIEVLSPRALSLL